MLNILSPYLSLIFKRTGSTKSSTETSKHNAPPSTSANSSSVQLLQEQLIAAGFNVGSTGPDGILGPFTQAAINAAKALGYTILNNLLIKPSSSSSTKSTKNPISFDTYMDNWLTSKRTDAATMFKDTYSPNLIANSKAIPGHSTDWSKYSDEELRKMFTTWKNLLVLQMKANPKLHERAKANDEKSLRIFDDAIKNPSKYRTSFGFNCIHSAMQGYGLDIYNVEDFSLRASKLGFQKIDPRDGVLKGDVKIIARPGKGSYGADFTDASGETRHWGHMLMVTDASGRKVVISESGGDPGTYTMSDGMKLKGRQEVSTSGFNFRRTAGKLQDEGLHQFYRYVGTPADSAYVRRLYNLELAAGTLPEQKVPSSPGFFSWIGNLLGSAPMQLR